MIKFVILKLQFYLHLVETINSPEHFHCCFVSQYGGTPNAQCAFGHWWIFVVDEFNTLITFTLVFIESCSNL